MRTFKTLADVESAGLTLAVKNVVIGCIQSLMDAYGDYFDADEVGEVVLLDRDTTDDDAYELFGMTWVEGLYEGVTYAIKGSGFQVDKICSLSCHLRSLTRSMTRSTQHR